MTTGDQSPPGVGRRKTPDPEARLDELLASCGTDDWDSYGGHAVTPAAVETAKRLVRGMWIGPTNRGGIEVEFEADKQTVSFEIARDGTVSGIYFDRVVLPSDESMSGPDA